MSRYTGPGRFAARSDNALSRDDFATVQARARKVVGDLQNQVNLGNVWQGFRRVRLAEDTEVVASVDATYPDNPLVQVHLVLPQDSTAPRSIEVYDYEIFILRGTIIETGPNNIFNVVTHALSSYRFTTSAEGAGEQGSLLHLWEAPLPNVQDFTNGFVDVWNSLVIGKAGRTTLFDPAVAMVWSCFIEVFIPPDTMLQLSPTNVESLSSEVEPQFSATQIAGFTNPEWRYSVTEDGACSNRITRPPDYGPASDYGFHWHPARMDLVGSCRWEGKTYILNVGFLNLDDLFVRTQIREIDDSALTDTVLLSHLWPPEYSSVNLHGFQFDASRGVMYGLVRFVNEVELVRYDIPNHDFKRVLLSNSFTITGALGFDPVSGLLTATYGNRNDSVKLDFIAPDSLEVLGSTNILESVPHAGGNIVPAQGIASLYGGRIVIASYNSREALFALDVNDEIVSLVILKRNEEGGYDIVDIVKRPNIAPDHPTNLGSSDNSVLGAIFLKANKRVISV